MTILVVNNKGQYNHRIQRSLQYLKIESELVSNTLSIDEIEAKNPTGLILGGGPSLEGAGNSEDYIKHFDIPILGICLGHQLIAKTYGGEVSTSNTESYAQVTINIQNDEKKFAVTIKNMRNFTVGLLGVGIISVLINKLKFSLNYHFY